MSFTEAVFVFFSSLLLSAISSAVMSRRLDQATAWLRFPEGLVGLITALGADTPEIASALTGMMSGNHDLGLGVIFGSNIFNLVALLGASAVVASQIRIGSAGVLLNGGVALWISGVIAAQVAGLIPPFLSGILIGIAVVPYVGVLALSPQKLAELPGPRPVTAWLCRAVGGAREDSRKAETPPEPSWIDLLALIPLLVMIIIASVGLVHSALVLGSDFGISKTVIGTLVLAPLTGLPNLITAMSLAKKGRGAATVVEAFNSNTLNLCVGVFLPSIIVGLGKVSGQSMLSLWWMIAMTLGTTVWCTTRRGLSWPGGAALIAVYLAFVLVIIL